MPCNAIESGLKSWTNVPLYEHSAPQTSISKASTPREYHSCRRPFVPRAIYGSGTSLVRLKRMSGLYTAFQARPRILDVSMMACKGNQRILKPYPQTGRGTVWTILTFKDMTRSDGNVSCVQGQRSDAGTLHSSQVVELL